MDRYDTELVCYKEQMALGDLFREAIDMTWKNPIKKIKTILKAVKIEREFYIKYPEMKENK